MSLFISFINYFLYFVKALVHRVLEKKVALLHTVRRMLLQTCQGNRWGVFYSKWSG